MCKPWGGQRPTRNAASPGIAPVPSGSVCSLNVDKEAPNTIGVKPGSAFTVHPPRQSLGQGGAVSNGGRGSAGRPAVADPAAYGVGNRAASGPAGIGGEYPGFTRLCGASLVTASFLGKASARGCAVKPPVYMVEPVPYNWKSIPTNEDSRKRVLPTVSNHQRGEPSKGCCRNWCGKWTV